MQTALSFSPSFPPISTPTKALGFPGRAMPRLHLLTRSSSIKGATLACAASSDDNGSTTSVFPVEACETIGGEACDVEMYPEVKLPPEAESKKASPASETIDREYMEYNSPKTVFREEACDDLGGEFCKPEYQTEA